MSFSGVSFTSYYDKTLNYTNTVNICLPSWNSEGTIPFSIDDTGSLVFDCQFGLDQYQYILDFTPITGLNPNYTLSGTTITMNYVDQNDNIIDLHTLTRYGNTYNPPLGLYSTVMSFIAMPIITTVPENSNAFNFTHVVSKKLSSNNVNVNNSGTLTYNGREVLPSNTQLNQVKHQTISNLTTNNCAMLNFNIVIQNGNATLTGYDPTYWPNITNVYINENNHLVVKYSGSPVVPYPVTNVLSSTVSVPGDLKLKIVRSIMVGDEQSEAEYEILNALAESAADIAMSAAVGVCQIL